MEVKEVNYKRFVPSEGMALKWKTREYNIFEEKISEQVRRVPHEMTIDTNTLIGEVEEITMEEYKASATVYCMS